MLLNSGSAEGQEYRDWVNYINAAARLKFGPSAAVFARVGVGYTVEWCGVAVLRADTLQQLNEKILAIRI